MKVSLVNDLGAIENTIYSGLVFLKKNQPENGNFQCISTPSPQAFKKGVVYDSIFSTILILQCLSELKKDFNLFDIDIKSIQFLVSQKSQCWTFNYWRRDSIETKEMPFPDDLDDTFCALSCLYNYCPQLIDGEVLANATAVLTSMETQEGGPYRSWVVPKNSDKIWLDVDVAVNANIGYFLKLQDIELPKLNLFIQSKIKDYDFDSPYYFGPFPTIYFISRHYRGKYIKDIKSFLINHKKGKKNHLEKALIISSLLNLNIEPKEVEEDIKYLLSSQKNGSWKPYTLIVEALKGKGVVYSGSSALTTAFCLEALGKYLEAFKKGESLIQQNTFDIKRNSIQKKILEDIKGRLKTTDRYLKEKTMRSLKTMVGNKSNAHVFLLPFLFKEALGTKGEVVPDNLLTKLAVANLLGWFSYGIYDDFLDEEGKPPLLPMANLTSREFYLLVSNLLSGKNRFLSFFKTVMDNIDSANLWEVDNCRFKVKNGRVVIKRKDLPDWKNYQKLAQRSLGHVLSPVAILYYLGFNKSSKELTYFMKFLTYYLIAKQLNDDAHDFESDFKSGILTPPVSKLLMKYMDKRNSLEVKCKMTEIFPILQEIFWTEILDDICKDITNNINSARGILQKMTYFDSPLLFDSLLLIPLEKAVSGAIKERGEMVKFFKSYRAVG